MDDPLTLDINETLYCPLSGILWDVDEEETTSQVKAQIFVGHTGSARVRTRKITKQDIHYRDRREAGSPPNSLRSFVYRGARRTPWRRGMASAANQGGSKLPHSKALRAGARTMAARMA